MPHIYVPSAREVVEAVATHSVALAILAYVLFVLARTRHNRYPALVTLLIGSVGGVLACFALFCKDTLSLFSGTLDSFLSFTLPMLLVSRVLPIAAGLGMFASWTSLMLYGAAREPD